MRDIIMEPQVLYKKLISTIRPVLKEHGFSRKGNIFYTLKCSNFGLIGFQKSVKSNDAEVLFTINIGVRSKVLSSYFRDDFDHSKPSFQWCNWETRVGQLINNGQDKWWSITPDTLFEDLFDEISTCLSSIAIPYILKNISDDQLISSWISGKSLGLPNSTRLVYLSVLLKNLGTPEQFEAILNELDSVCRSGTSLYFAKAHLRRIREHKP